MTRLLIHPAAFALALLPFAAAEAADLPKPNILVILADDLGYSDLGCYGGEIKTPNLDKLAADGLRFTQFYNCARCCPTRASILTGLYPHQAGVGAMTGDDNQPGYRGFLQPNAVAIPQVLKPAGYRSYISGKWHLTNKSGPIARGFDEGYVMIEGFRSFWDPKVLVRLPADRKPRAYEPGQFYSTDAITDHALDFLADAKKHEKPFFLYLAYTAPHFPLHAPKEEVAKYAGVYAKGWDKLREERAARQKQLGLFPRDWPLPPRSEYWTLQNKSTGTNPAWDSLDADRRADLARRMAVYAGMVDRMDQNVGRVLEALKGHGQFENTLVLFLSDNGACAEWDPWGFDTTTGPNNILHKGDDLDKLGGPGSYISYGSGWANACNTPWRLYKHYGHEGGIGTPLIAHWPAGLKRKGQIDHRPGHLIDVMATCVDAAGAAYPKQFNGSDITPAEGRSLLPALCGEPATGRTLYFEHEGNRAVRDGKWKLVWIGMKAKWELYDIDADRTEMNDLAAAEPERVRQMAKMWDDWAARANVLRPKDKKK